MCWCLNCVQEVEEPVVHVVQQYKHCRREDMLQYEIFDYLPGHSTVYKQWIQQQPARYNWDRWIVTGFIGVVIGITGLFMQQTILSAAHFKWSYTDYFIRVSPVPGLFVLPILGLVINSIIGTILHRFRDAAA